MGINGGQWEPMGANAETISFIMFVASSVGSMGVNGG